MIPPALSDAAIMCPEPNVLPNTNMVVKSTKYTSKVTYTCAERFISMSFTLTCSDTGLWEGEIFQCQRKLYEEV